MSTHQHLRPAGPAQPSAGHASAEAHDAGAGDGPVLVDIGDGAGALVLHADAAMAGAEIEISPAGQDARRTHVAVLARPLGGSTVHAAVYPSLAAGTWDLWDPRTGTVALTVTVADGEVTEARWPTARA